MNSRPIFFVAIVLATGATGVAQEIRAPAVLTAVASKTSTDRDIRALMNAAPISIWREGDPVIVKDDLEGVAGIAQPGQAGPLGPTRCSDNNSEGCC
jgi:hypothetical protein